MLHDGLHGLRPLMRIVKVLPAKRGRGESEAQKRTCVPSAAPAVPISVTHRLRQALESNGRWLNVGKGDGGGNLVVVQAARDGRRLPRGLRPVGLERRRSGGSAHGHLVLWSFTGIHKVVLLAVVLKVA